MKIDVMLPDDWNHTAIHQRDHHKRFTSIELGRTESEMLLGP